MLRGVCAVLAPTWAFSSVSSRGPEGNWSSLFIVISCWAPSCPPQIVLQAPCDPISHFEKNCLSQFSSIPQHLIVCLPGPVEFSVSKPRGRPSHWELQAAWWAAWVYPFAWKHLGHEKRWRWSGARQCGRELARASKGHHASLSEAPWPLEGRLYVIIYFFSCSLF